MIFSAVLSRPRKDAERILGRAYVRVRIWRNAGASLNAAPEYSAEFFTRTQSFRRGMTASEADDFISRNAGTVFRNALVRTEDKELTYLSNRHGEVKILERKIKGACSVQNSNNLSGHNRTKNYILKEGEPVSFLVRLGVMTQDGKVTAKRYDKFRQINRFLEYVADILPSVQKMQDFTEENPLRILDFGSGKSYLTFALYHYLRYEKKIPVHITGLDLKEDVIADCSRLAKDCGYDGLDFETGNIADYDGTERPHMVVTLHACDTATDFALDYAVRMGALAILCVPCCQHQVNAWLSSKDSSAGVPEEFKPLLRYGIIRDRFSALVTDAVRAELLESRGYDVQVLEFIDMAHTPKNIMLRAVRKPGGAVKETKPSALTAALGVTVELQSLFAGEA